MTDRKPGEEPSLFDLPLRRTRDGAPEREPEHGQEHGPERESKRSAEAEADTRRTGGGEGDAGEPGGGERGRTGAGEPREELAFWEMEPDPGGERSTRAPATPTPPPESSRPESSHPTAREGTAADGAAAASWADLETGEAARDEASGDEASGDDGAEAGPAAESPAAVPAALTHRLAASLLDGGVLLVVTAGAILGAFLLGVRWRADDLPALGMFLLVFSFVYSVMPLAFWGRTPGMALARLLSRGADGGPLTFGQTALRWLAGLVTVALVGLPLLLALPALGGRSLADRLSGSHTWLQPDA